LNWYFLYLCVTWLCRHEVRQTLHDTPPPRLQLPAQVTRPRGPPKARRRVPRAAPVHGALPSGRSHHVQRAHHQRVAAGVREPSHRSRPGHDREHQEAFGHQWLEAATPQRHAQELPGKCLVAIHWAEMFNYLWLIMKDGIMITILWSNEVINCRKNF